MYFFLLGDSLQGDVTSLPIELQDSGEEGEMLHIRFFAMRKSAGLIIFGNL